MILATLVLNLNLVDLLGVSWATSYGQQLGLTLEALLLSFVLGARMNDLQCEREQIAGELLHMRQQANQRLQHEVEAKTQALNQAMSELRTANAA
jgi:putative copper export protein